MKVASSFFAILLISAAVSAKEVPFTLENRDRIIRLEQKVDANFIIIDEKLKAMDQKYDQRFQSIEDSIRLMQTMLIFIMGGMLGFEGFILWDRRSSLLHSKIKPIKTT